MLCSCHHQIVCVFAQLKVAYEQAGCVQSDGAGNDFKVAIAREILKECTVGANRR